MEWLYPAGQIAIKNVARQESREDLVGPYSAERLLNHCWSQMQLPTGGIGQGQQGLFSADLFAGVTIGTWRTQAIAFDQLSPLGKRFEDRHRADVDKSWARIALTRARHKSSKAFNLSKTIDAVAALKWMGKID